MPVNIGMSQNFNFYYYFHVTVTDGLLIEKPICLGIMIMIMKSICKEIKTFQKTSLFWCTGSQ